MLAHSITQLALVALPLVASLARADVVPTAPGPGDSFDEGANTIQWDLDTTGTWTDFTIQLMTGSNLAMVPLETVATGLDGTSGATSLDWTCPQVTPNSAIYFYQFTQTGGNTSWTTRFTIASATGESTAPLSSTVSNGQVIKWGTGSLVGKASSSASAVLDSSAASSSTLPATSSLSSSSAGAETTLSSSSSSSSSFDATTAPAVAAAVTPQSTSTGSTSSTASAAPVSASTAQTSTSGAASSVAFQSATAFSLLLAGSVVALFA